ncbi:MAG TPA: aminoglycoside phosphotransferase family protein [Actinoplanes sp.]|nr:aminoglycoside phosphotransferase family protein [Actinoplanes sp.]
MTITPVIEVPAVVRAKAELADAGDWLAGLPDLVARLEREWGIAVGRPYTGGTEAYVAEATRADGTPAVLKLMIPRPGDHAVHEITALRLAGGQGCAALLAADEDRGGMLLERLGPSLYDLGVPFERRLEILTGLAATVWRPVAGADLPSGADKARWLAGFITRNRARASPEAVRHALACAASRERAHDDTKAVLVHGDVHQWNALRTGDGGFKLVDPDGLRAEPEYDLGVLMREDPVELMAGDPWDRAYRLAGRTGTDPVAIWEWGVVERVSTGLIATAIDLEPVGTQMLVAAADIARRARP